MAADLEPGDLHDRVLKYLASHPGGTRMTDLGQEFGLARIQMARVLRDLMDKKKVEKREFFYFVVDTAVSEEKKGR